MRKTLGFKDRVALEFKFARGNFKLLDTGSKICFIGFLLIFIFYLIFWSCLVLDSIISKDCSILLNSDLLTSIVNTFGSILFIHLIWHDNDGNGNL